MNKHTKDPVGDLQEARKILEAMEKVAKVMIVLSVLSLIVCGALAVYCFMG